MTEYLYTFRFDTPITPPLIAKIVPAMKVMKCHRWLIGPEEKKENEKIHFHGWMISKFSENTIKKKFKEQIPSLYGGNTSSYSLKIIKKENKSILLNPKNAFSKDIENLKSYPIKEVKDIKEYIKNHTFRGVSKAVINKLHEIAIFNKNKKKIKKEKKSKKLSDFQMIWSHISSHFGEQFIENTNHKKLCYKEVYYIVEELHKIIYSYYNSIGKKLPYKTYTQSMIHSYMCKLSQDYTLRSCKSNTNEFMNTYHRYYIEEDQEEISVIPPYKEEEIAQKVEENIDTQFLLEFN